MQRNNFSKEDFYKSKAAYFEGVAIMRRITACVHLEGESDKYFWERVLKKYFPEGKFFFLSYSKNASQNRISGVEHCLKYRKYLSRRFFICIDSDYRYLLGAKHLDASGFVLQTYTYAIENHYCYSRILSRVCSEATGEECDLFDFRKFYTDYSNIIYPLFIWHLYLLRNTLPGMSKLKFNALLGNFPRIDLRDNGELMLRSLRERVKAKLLKLERMYPGIDIRRFYKDYKPYGLTKDTAYLFVRGHNIYDLTINIGRSCNRELLNRKRESLVRDGFDDRRVYENTVSFEQQLLNLFPQKGYSQMERIARDVSILKKNY